jgi:cytoskeletal protein CcmA (bactofilin family)
MRKMFYRSKPSGAAQSSDSVFGRSVTISGDLVADHPLRIDGAIDGDVRGTVVIVGRKASIKGSVHAESVKIAGRIAGLVQATTVSVTRHARLEGQLVCQRLEVEKGAEIMVHCKAW